MASEGHEGVRRAGEGEGKKAPKNPFWKMDPTAWELVAELLPKPWPRELAEMDLRHWVNEARRPDRTVPGARILSARWGWTHWKARQLLVEVDPCDLAAMTARTPRRTVAAQSPHGRRTVEEGGTPVIEDIPHGGRTVAARSPPSRDPFLEEGQEDQDPQAPTVADQAQAPEAAKAETPKPDPVRDVWLSWKLAYEDFRTSAPKWNLPAVRKTAPNRAEARAIGGRLGEGATVEECRQVVTWALRDGTDDYARYLRGEHSYSPDKPATPYPDVETLFKPTNWEKRLRSALVTKPQPGGIAKPGPSELELRRWYDLEGGREWCQRNALTGLNAAGLWRDWMGPQRLDEWWTLERWLRSDAERRTA
jgi:hypothetical protein